MAIKVTSDGALLYFLQKLRQMFVARELRTGSSSCLLYTSRCV